MRFRSLGPLHLALLALARLNLDMQVLHIKDMTCRIKQYFWTEATKDSLRYLGEKSRNFAAIKNKGLSVDG